MIEIREYTDEKGRSPFQNWFDELDRAAAAKVSSALYRLSLGNFSNVKGVGAGVFEYRIHFGAGYRVYFGKEGDRIVILLGGGTKKNQSADIREAYKSWQDYKSRQERT